MIASPPTHPSSLFMAPIKTCAQCGAELPDVCAATAFVKHTSGAAHFRDALHDRALDSFPAVCVVAEICRDELLFELDAEVAVHPGGD